jgi:hypothetical protein
MNVRINQFKKLLVFFHGILTKDSIFSFAVFSEITLVQDSLNGPFLPSGKPKWHHVTYEKAFNDYYNFIYLIESCGFKLHNVVENGGVHFDEIDVKLHLKKHQTTRLSKLERRNIYNFIKV